MSRFDTSAVTTDLFGPAASILVGTVRTIAFWVAIALPFLYVPLLASGSGANVLLPVAALAVVNVVALVVGHGHRRDAVTEG